MLGFGAHLAYNAHGCPTARLGDLDSLYRLLDNFPDRIRRPRIMPRYVSCHGVAGEASEGVSGFVLIAERDRQRVAGKIGLEASS